MDNEIVPNIHIGEALRIWCKRNHLTRQKLADEMGLPKSNIDRILSKPTIETNKLLEFSHVLRCNFFAAFFGEQYFVDSETEMEYLDTTPSYIHIGQKIEICLKEKKRTQNQLADLLGVKHPVISKLLRKDSIDSGRLVMISNFLGHDFFVDFYKDIIPNIVSENTFLQDKIRNLENTIEKLQEENLLLKQKLSKYEK